MSVYLHNYVSYLTFLLNKSRKRHTLYIIKQKNTWMGGENPLQINWFELLASMHKISRVINETILSRNFGAYYLWMSLEVETGENNLVYKKRKCLSDVYGRECCWVCLNFTESWAAMFIAIYDAERNNSH